MKSRGARPAPDQVNSMSDIEISIEFFPPKTDQGFANFRLAREELSRLNPAFFSVTFGAGGSTRDGTMEAVSEIIQTGQEGVPHISCIATSRESVARMLDQYRELLRICIDEYDKRSLSLVKRSFVFLMENTDEAQEFNGIHLVRFSAGLCSGSYLRKGKAINLCG